MHPLQHLGMNRHGDKQAVNRAITWIRFLSLDLYCLLDSLGERGNNPHWREDGIRLKVI